MPSMVAVALTAWYGDAALRRAGIIGSAIGVGSTVTYCSGTPHHRPGGAAARLRLPADVRRDRRGLDCRNVGPEQMTCADRLAGRLRDRRHVFRMARVEHRQGRGIERDGRAEDGAEA